LSDSKPGGDEETPVEAPRAAPVKRLNSHLLSAIPPERFFSQTVYLDSQFILAAPEMPFSQELIDTLEE
jgi:hypothetical protein